MGRWLALFAIVHSLIERGSYLVFFLVLLSAGVGAPVAEELVVLAAGALSRQGVTKWWAALAVCWLGVVIGDIILFLAARKLGSAALRHPRFQKLLPPDRRKKLERFYRRRGGLAISIGRQIPGVRAPLFALAGINRMKLDRFIFWDALAACISVPFVFYLGWIFSDQLERMQTSFTHIEHLVILLLVAFFAAWIAISYWRSSGGHRLGEARRRWREWRKRRARR